VVLVTVAAAMAGWSVILTGWASRLAGDGGRGRRGRGQPASSRRWAVQVRVFALHTGAGWACWRVSVRSWLGAF